MNWRRYLWQTLAVVGGILIGIGAVFVLQPPPTTFTSVREPDGIVVSGARMEMLFNVTRRRLCPMTVERQLWQWRIINGERLQYIVPLPNLSLGVTVITLLIFAMAYFIAWQSKDQATMLLMAGAIIVMAKDGIGYWFSRNSGTQATADRQADLVDRQTAALAVSAPVKPAPTP